MNPRATRSDAEAPEIRFWGVRGSVAVPGPGTVVYGGNTSCIEVRLGGNRFIVDAGTGIVPLGQDGDWQDDDRHGDAPVHILMTHLHHDHIVGLPFFKPVYQRDREIHIWCGNLGGESAEQALLRMFAPPLFPFTLGAVPARLVFHGFKAGAELVIAGQTIRTVALDHPDGATGYRFDGPGGSAAIITDIEHRGSDPDPAVVRLCRDVDTLVYDMMLDENEYGSCKGWGHSTASAAVRLADVAGVRRLVGFHHAPGHDDARMADREARLHQSRPGSLMARDGMRLVCQRTEAPTADASVASAPSAAALGFAR
ncbi:MAG: MBL fold metallo-hydrolase [Bosea sp. (in: a-proteobacteria)]